MFEYALSECSIPKAMGRHLQFVDGVLRAGNDVYDLSTFSSKKVVSIGKAGHSMAEALTSIVGGGLSGIVACPSPPSDQVFGLRYFIGGHPMPNEESVRAAEAILGLLTGCPENSLVLFLISGGASAIAEKPIADNISLPDVVATYKTLVHSGAPIADINAIRKHLSAIKGGRMALAAGSARQISVLVSDVPEHALDALASGPTMPDTTTVSDCYSIAERYQMLRQFPASVRTLFEQEQLEETPKPGDRAFDRASYITVLSNATAEDAAVEQAKLDGFAVEVDNTCDDWDYADAADHLLSRLRQMRNRASRVCLISGGEVTVKVGAKSGAGGRNQQFALYCAQKIAGERVTVLSAGTDGIDGNSPAAGAVADGTTVARAQERGLDACGALKEFDAYPLFDALGDAIMTGPTGNNVRDLRILLAY